MAAPTTMQCEDFLEFQESIKKLRVLDDKIIHALNTSIPTDSFQNKVNAASTCQQLYSQLQQNYNQRETAIKRCISVVTEKVEKMKSENNQSVIMEKNIKKEKTKLRLLSAELNVEEIIKDRTNKVYYERCRPFYKPPSLFV